MTQKAPPRPRITETAPGGPPYLGLLLDLETVQCLALGAVNSRAEVAAQLVLASYEASILVRDDNSAIWRRQGDKAMTDDEPSVWRRLMEQWRVEAGPRVEDTAENFPAGHDMTEWRFVTHYRADELEAALRACADPPEESREAQDVGAILQSVLQMIGLPAFNAAWFDAHGEWDFGKLRAHGLDAKLAEIRAALRACAEAPATIPPRIRELAEERARLYHNGSDDLRHFRTTGPDKWRNNQERGLDPWRFEECPHPDCALLRAEALAPSPTEKQETEVDTRGHTPGNPQDSRTASQNEVLSAPTPELVDYNELDPGIRDVVRVLREAGFDTTDSGDGVTKTHVDGCTMPVPNIAAMTTRAAMFDDVDRMAAILTAIHPDWHVEASYSTEDTSYVLLAVQQNENDAVLSIAQPREHVENEICICAAIVTAEGHVIRGHRHADCMRTAADNELKHRPGHEWQGFITSCNRYVDRKEAARLQIAAGIVSADQSAPYLHGECYSEDLYLFDNDSVAAALALEEALATNAVDPSAQLSGTPTPRDETSSGAASSPVPAAPRAQPEEEQP